MLEALYAVDDPLTAEQIAAGLDGRVPRSDIGSVYRNLETLEQIGLIRHFHLGHGPGLYLRAGAAAREYLVCDSCGALRSLEPRSLDEVRELIRTFVREREWDQFHDPKNLAMAVASEAGELVAELRWVPSEEADAYAARPDVRARLEDEAADVAITLLMFFDRTGIDPLPAIRKKMAKNAAKYPRDEVRGRHE